MNNDNRFVQEESVRELLQYFFDSTKIGEKCGSLPIEEDRWIVILKDFKKKFNQDPITKEYKVDVSGLFIFVNEQMMNFIESVMLGLVDDGLMIMSVDQKGDIVFRRKDRS